MKYNEVFARLSKMNISEVFIKEIALPFIQVDSEEAEYLINILEFAESEGQVIYMAEDIPWILFTVSEHSVIAHLDGALPPNHSRLPCHIADPVSYPNAALNEQPTLVVEFSHRLRREREVELIRLDHKSLNHHDVIPLSTPRRRGSSRRDRFDRDLDER